MVILVEFTVDNIGGHPDGFAQERIKIGTGQWSEWVPPSEPPEEDEIFWFDGGIIYDKKTINANWSTFENAANGATVLDVYQQNRTRIKDCSGQFQDYPFEVIHFHCIKVDDTTWKIEQQ